MMNRIFSGIGWLGTALVLAAVGIRYFLPAREQYATYLAEAGLVCMVLYILSQWREIAGYFETRQARYGTLAAFERLHRARHPRRRQLHRQAAATSAGT